MDLNESTNNTDDCARPDIHYWEQILTGTLIGLIGILGIMGNSMIILAVIFSRRLQTSTNAFVTSLSIADLITSFFLLFYMIGVFGRNSWPIPQASWLCSLTAFMILMCRGTSLYTMAAIAINRLLCIINPSLYQKIFVSWKLVICLIVPWAILGISISSMCISAGFTVFGYDRLDLACTMDSANIHAGQMSFTINLIAFPIPLLTTTVSYSWIYVHLKKHFRAQKRSIRRSSLDISMINMTNYTHSSDPSSLASGPSSDEHSQIEGGLAANGPSASVKEHSQIQGVILCQAATIQRKRISKEQIEITKNLFTVVCSLYLCFLIYFILSFLPNSRHILFYIRVITLANGTINFGIYAGKHPDFKIVFGHMIRRSFANIPQPSRFLRFLLLRNI